MGAIASLRTYSLDAGADWLFGAVYFLDFPELGAYLSANRAALCHGTAEAHWDANAWRRRHLEARVPLHIQWRPAADSEFHASCASSQTPVKLRKICDLGGFRGGACTFWLAQGLRFYEQKQFEAAAEDLRVLLKILPGRTQAMCHLADALYGRAVSLHTAVFSTPPPLQRQEASSQLVRPRPSQEVVREDSEVEGRDAAGIANPSLYSRLPSSSPHAARSASIDARQTLSSAADTDRLALPGHRISESGTAGQVDDEAVEETLAASHGNGIIRGEALQREQQRTLNRPGEPDEVEEVGDEEDADAASEKRIAQLEVIREKLLAEAKELYEEAHRLEPSCSLAVNGLALFIKTKPEKVKLLEQAVELDGQNSYALANLGGELLGTDDQKALKFLNRALEINPKLFYARLCKSKVMLRLGDLAGAVEAARSQLEWQPNDEMAARLLSQLEFRFEIVRRRMLLT